MRGGTTSNRGAFCTPRSGYAGSPRPHLYTTKHNKPKPKVTCSWCGVTKKVTPPKAKKGKKKR